jgi:hypothetical protein
MEDIGKKAEREKKSRAYRELLRSLAPLAGVYVPTSSSVFDCLGKAHLSEQEAISSMLARKSLFREDPSRSAPEELSNGAISAYWANAGDLYGAAATEYVLLSELASAFKCFRKASVQCQQAAELQSPGSSRLLEKLREYKQKAAILRHELARRSLRRKKLSLGLLGRLR